MKVVRRTTKVELGGGRRDRMKETAVLVGRAVLQYL